MQLTNKITLDSYEKLLEHLMKCKTLDLVEKHKEWHHCCNGIENEIKRLTVFFHKQCIINCDVIKQKLYIVIVSDLKE